MIQFRNASIPMGRDRRLTVADWMLKAGECWVIAGKGGSGKTSLARAVAGISGPAGRDTRIPGIERRSALSGEGAWISFDREKEIRQEIRRNDDSEWSGRPDDGTSLKNFLGTDDAWDYLDRDLAGKLSDRGIRHLSTGEFRQVLIAREAGKRPVLVVLDEPWEGLDVSARPRLTEMLKSLLESGVLVVLTVNRQEDIPLFATGIIHIDKDAARTGKINGFAASSRVKERLRIPLPATAPPEVGEILIEMRNVHLAYQGRRVLENMNWCIRSGESWLLTGPNGSGKTSMLNLISGDEPRAYGQEIYLFGRRKGSGESTSWIRERMGRVSSALQEQVSPHSKAAEAVGSGLRDAFVLTEPLDGYETRLVRDWLSILGMKGRGETPFCRLSYSEQRLAMIARAMIKHPPLLLLDEPMHGLDDSSRDRVAEITEALIRETGTTVLYVSHRPEDAPGSITRHLQLIPGNPEEGSRTVISERKLPDTSTNM